jgi:histidinol-phosphate aminotransferase
VAIRSAIAAIEPYRPGLSVAEVKARSLGLEQVVKLGSNESAFPPPEAALRAAAQAAMDANRYPDPWLGELRAALASVHGVREDQVVPGAGADELIRLLAAVTLEPGRSCVFPWPGFPTHAQAALIAGARAVAVSTPPDRLDLEALLAAIDASTSLVCVATPNNPTGAAASRQQIEAFLDALPETVTCLIDEAYFEFADPELRAGGGELVAAGRPNVCAIRTFSKAYGLAGFRIGYAVTSPELADGLNRVRSMFNASEPAQAAALAALGAEAQLESRVEHVRAGRQRLTGLLAAAGLRPYPSQGNFVFAEVPGRAGGADSQAAAALADDLLRQGVIVRAMGGFGAPGAIRVTIGTRAEEELLADALSRARRHDGAA